MMRASAPILGLLVILAAAEAQAANYYVDAESGDDTNAGTAPDAPWRTLAKVSDPATQAALVAGDSVLFHRGQRFPGSLRITRSGTSRAPITYGAYGDGERPQLSGFVTAGEWTPSGDGVWVSTCAACTNPPNMVLLDGQVVALGRYPNADAPGGGYLTYEARDGTTSITDDELTGDPDWTGAEVVIRKVRWIIDRNPITSHVGSTISYIAPSPYLPTVGFGYFIQNDRRTLDAPGEWYFDPVTKELFVHFGPEGPAGRTVEVSAVDTLITVKDQQHVTIEGLAVHGASRDGIDASASLGLRLVDCDIRYTGGTALRAGGSQGAVVTANTFAWTHDNAIDMFSSGTKCSDAVVEGNRVSDTGTLTGMGGSNDGHHQAITVNCNGARVERNIVERTGYTAINFQGSDILVANNFVDGFDLVKDDGGGIYTFTGKGNPASTDRRVIANIVLNGVGAPDGADHSVAAAHGIYLDDYADAVEVAGNTVAHHSGSGIFLHNNYDVVVTGNTAFDSAEQLLVFNNIDPDIPESERNVTLHDNTFVARTPGQLVLRLAGDLDEFAVLGDLDRNRYARPADDSFTIVRSVQNQAHAAYDLPRWTKHYGHDAQSRASAVRIPAYQVMSTGENLILNGNFDVDVDGAGAWSSQGNAVVSWSNDGQLDGGAVHYTFDPPSAVANASLLTFATAPVSASENYLLRFSGVASGDLSFEVFLRHAETGAALVPSAFGGLSTARSEQEFLFVAPLDEQDPAVNMNFNEKDTFGPFWIDGIGLFPAQVQLTDLAAAFRLEYNADAEPRTVSLGEPHLDVAGAHYDGDLELAPGASLVLIKASLVTSPVITSADAASGTVDVPFAYEITAKNAPTMFAASTLPPGLTIDPGTGLIAGTPTMVGVTEVTITASSPQGEGSRLLTITIHDPAAADDDSSASDADSSADDADDAGDGGDEGDSTPTGGHSDTAGTGDETGASDDGPGSEPSDGSCGCRARRTEQPAPVTGLALLAVVLATTRRSRPGARRV